MFRGDLSFIDSPSLIGNLLWESPDIKLVGHPNHKPSIILYFGPSFLCLSGVPQILFVLCKLSWKGPQKLIDSYLQFKKLDLPYHSPVSGYFLIRDF
jgi:hypothetical protein